MDFRSSWVIRQKGEFRKCVYHGVRNVRFSENFGVLCFIETSVLPFALLPLPCCLICLIASLPFCRVFSLPIWITNFIITIWITKSHILIFQNRECWKLWDFLTFNQHILDIVLAKQTVQYSFDRLIRRHFANYLKTHSQNWFNRN